MENENSLQKRRIKWCWRVKGVSGYRIASTHLPAIVRLLLNPGSNYNLHRSIVTRKWIFSLAILTPPTVTTISIYNTCIRIVDVCTRFIVFLILQEISTENIIMRYNSFEIITFRRLTSAKVLRENIFL